MPVAKLAVNEIFGPSIQGEGPSTGRLSMFLRLAGCNLTCVYCDTSYTWRWGQGLNKDDEVHQCTLEYVTGQLVTLAGDLIHRRGTILVCTGGEPLLQDKKLIELVLPFMSEHGWEVEIETNGTRIPNMPPRSFGVSTIRFIVSPKLSNSECKPSKRYKPKVLKWFRDQGATFKFVCQSPKDLGEVQQIVDEIGIRPSQVWIMPEGIDGIKIHDRLQDLVGEVIKRGWNITSRLHTWIWGNARRR